MEEGKIKKYIKIVKQKFEILKNLTSHEQEEVEKEEVQRSVSQSPGSIDTVDAVKKGTGILVNSNKRVDFVYYTDPNDLVKRLKLLLASQKTGSDAHRNEIESIIGELKTKGIIKNDKNRSH